MRFYLLLSSFYSLLKRNRNSLIAFVIGIVIAANLYSVNAQDLRPDTVAAKVYQSLNEFPTENQHLSSETGQPATDNTLVSRIIRYHQYVKNRPVEYRLDWKLTLADYLGANETIELSSYPGNTTLKNNPLESDRAVISKLDRSQRNKLIETLLSIYNPQTQPSVNTESTPEGLDADNGDNNQNSRQKIPRRGNADLLLP